MHKGPEVEESEADEDGLGKADGDGEVGPGLGRSRSSVSLGVLRAWLGPRRIEDSLVYRVTDTDA